MFPAAKYFLLSMLLAAPVCAQTYTTKKIIFKHPGVFTQSQLEASSGLHAGMNVTGEDIANAAQKLADTQYFDNVQGAMEGSAAALAVTFDLTPAPAAKFLPAGFEDFVWLSPAEITAAIQIRVPLYNGTLAEGSAAVDDASAALQEVLEAKGIHAHVTCESVEPSLRHPLRALEFHVARPTVYVENVKLDGVSPSLVPLLQAAVNKAAKSRYNEGLNGVLTSDIILGPMLDAGYVKATLAGQTAELGAVTPNAAPIIVHATLSAGDVYHVGAITFAGSPLYSAADFAKNQKLKTGDLASMKLLLDTLQPIDDAYRAKGFLDVLVKSDPAFDEAAKTVSYSVTVMPGEPYTLHTITTQGLDDPGAQADFKRGFALKEGDAYNPVYVSGFIKNNTALRGFRTYTGVYKATAYPATHTVDLVLAFAGGTVNVDAR